jgi:uncharacterized OB-fold protein
MSVPRHWRVRSQRYALVGGQCPRCGALAFPPRPLCSACSRRAAVPSPTGVAQTYTLQVFDPLVLVLSQDSPSKRSTFQPARSARHDSL